MTDATSSPLNVPPRDRRDIALDRALRELRNAAEIAAIEIAVARRRNDAEIARLWRGRYQTWLTTIADIEALRGIGR